MNPFASKFTNFSGEPLIVLAADDRIRMVQDFTAAECVRALKLPNLQKTVRTAIERRQRKLQKVES